MQHLPQPPTPFASRQCANCGQPLTVHQALSGTTCDRHLCRHQASLQAIAARKADAHAHLIAEATRRRDRIAARRKPRAMPVLSIALVPASTRRSVALTATRRRLFREHLETLLLHLTLPPLPSRATQLPHEHADVTPRYREPPVVDAACSTCRGYCCHGGGVKAYIDDDTLLRFAGANPSLDDKGILHAYLSRLPRRSMQDSCVFHGTQGCTLPRDMRSATCNHYQCDGLQQLRQLKVAPVLITAASDTDVVRCSVFEN